MGENRGRLLHCFCGNRISEAEVSGIVLRDRENGQAGISKERCELPDVFPGLGACAVEFEVAKVIWLGTISVVLYRTVSFAQWSYNGLKYGV